jgi:O-antigen/teichoic acid export membrane protein
MGGSPATSPVVVGVLGKGAEAVTLVALTLLLPRVLGAADFGTFSVALSLVTIVSSAMALGGSTLLGRLVPAAAPEEQRTLARAIVARLAPTRALQAAGVLAGAGVVAVVAPGWVGVAGILLVGAAIVLEIAAALAYHAALGLGHTTLWSFRYPLQNTVLGTAVVALYALAGVDGAIGGILAASAVALGLGLLVAGRELRGAPAGASVPAGAMRFGVLLGLGGLLTQVSYRGVPVAAALLGAPDDEVGYAALASGVAVAVVYAVWQAFVVDLPHVSAIAVEQPLDAERRIRRIALGATLLLIPAALAAASLADWALPLLLGQEWSDAAPAFVPALAVLPLAAPAAVLTQVSALRMRAEARVGATGAGVAAFVLAALVAVPPFGATGATSALLVAMAVTIAVGALVLRGAFGGRLLVVAAGGAAAVLLGGALAVG